MRWFICLQSTVRCNNMQAISLMAWGEDVQQRMKDKWRGAAHLLDDYFYFFADSQRRQELCEEGAVKENTDTHRMRVKQL